jgi:hypothetical protein
MQLPAAVPRPREPEHSQAATGQTQATQQRQQTPPAPAAPKAQEWKPAFFPADAVAYGAALEAASPPKLKHWCDGFARKDMPKRKIDPREIMAVVDKQFPKNSDPARDAAIYLTTFLAYKEEDRTQVQTASSLRRLDEEIHDLVLDMKLKREREMNRMVSARATITPQEIIRNEAEARNDDEKLKEMNETRRKRVKELETSRKRVESYLKVMSVTHPRMNGIGPEVLREFQ